jgi:hypothetical protein
MKKKTIDFRSLYPPFRPGRETARLNMMLGCEDEIVSNSAILIRAEREEETSENGIQIGASTAMA